MRHDDDNVEYVFTRRNGARWTQMELDLQRAIMTLQHYQYQTDYPDEIQNAIDSVRWVRREHEKKNR